MFSPRNNTPMTKYIHRYILKGNQHTHQTHALRGTNLARHGYGDSLHSWSVWSFLPIAPLDEERRLSSPSLFRGGVPCRRSRVIRRLENTSPGVVADLAADPFAQVLPFPRPRDKGELGRGRRGMGFCSSASLGGVAADVWRLNYG